MDIVMGIIFYNQEDLWAFSLSLYYTAPCGQEYEAKQVESNIPIQDWYSASRNTEAVMYCQKKTKSYKPETSID